MRKVSFRFSIVQCYLLLTIITTLIICGTFYVYSKDAVITLANKIISEISSKANQRVSNFFHIPEMQEQVISNLVTTPNFVSQEDRLLKLLWELIQVQPNIESMSLSDYRGNYLQARLYPEPATRVINRNKIPVNETIVYRDTKFSVLRIEQKLNPDFDPRTRPWFKNIGDGQQTYWSEPYLANTTKRPVVSGSRHILTNGERIGVVNINIPLTELSQFMAQQQVSTNGIAFLVSINGDLLAFPDEQFLSIKDSSSGNFRLGKIADLPQNWIKSGWQNYIDNEKENFSFKVADTSYLASFRKLSQPTLASWRIGIVMPEKDVTNAVQQTLLMAFGVAGFIFLLSLFPLLWFARRLSRPIAQLVDQTRELKDFRLENITKINSPIHEINILSESIVAAAQGLRSFQKYIPAELVRQLMSTGEPIEIGGESRYLTMLFSDLKDFSTLSENTPSRELLLRVSSYFEIFINAIKEEGGYVDKFIGDSVMAFWGAPLPEHNHAYHACVAAVKAQHRMKLLNENLIKDEKPPLTVRIGLHADAVLVGNVGSPEKLSYTVMGDGVNIASRLEGINKDYDTGICISHSLFRESGERLWVRPIDIISVKGRKGELLIYELMGIKDGDAETAPTEIEKELCIFTKKAFDLYMNGLYVEALVIYEDLFLRFDDGLAAVMVTKCRSKINPNLS
jgi:adenylate cyclase